MPDQNRPNGRVKNITGNGKTVTRRGSGLGTGPVGSGTAGRKNGGRLLKAKLNPIAMDDEMSENEK